MEDMKAKFKKTVLVFALGLAAVLATQAYIRKIIAVAEGPSMVKKPAGEEKTYEELMERQKKMDAAQGVTVESADTASAENPDQIEKKKVTHKNEKSDDKNL